LAKTSALDRSIKNNEEDVLKVLVLGLIFVLLIMTPFHAVSGRCRKRDRRNTPSAHLRQNGNVELRVVFPYVLDTVLLAEFLDD
jgi:hypothetical protein